MHDPVAASVAAYSKAAADYQAIHAAKMRERAEQFAHALAVPSRVLDAGCGPGRDLARFTAHGHLARGVDLNPVFAAMAQAHAPTVVADLRHLSTLFAEATFDGVWACASLVHLPEPDAIDVLTQFRGLLRPGGKLYACVKARGESGWLDEPDGRRFYTVWNPETFTDTVARSGFTVDETHRDVFVEVVATRIR